MHDPVAADTVHCVIPANDDGHALAHIFARKDTLLTCVYGMKSDNQFDSALSDHTY